jgi:WD40 repeat protein
MPKWAIEDLKFSPDGKYLAVGGHDKKVFVYCLKPTLTFHGLADKSSSFITHIDWDTSSTFFRTNDGSSEIIYY